jgi:hypothetical protein
MRAPWDKTKGRKGLPPDADLMIVARGTGKRTARRRNAQQTANALPRGSRADFLGFL